MKIGVVGTFNRDRIFPWQGAESDSIGGIFFTVSYLASLFDAEVELCPVCYVGGDFAVELKEQLSAHANVRLDGLHPTAQSHVQVKLIYNSPQDRDEITTPLMPTLQWHHLQSLVDSDVVLVNLISGADVELAALQRLKQVSNTLVYMDFHYVATGVDGNGKRFWQQPENWREWIDAVDVLQLNEVEARTVAGLPEDAPLDALLRFGSSTLELNPTVCHITMGDRGSYLFFSGRGETHQQHFPAVPVPHIVDVTGCGDAFATGFLLEYLATENVIAATRFANQVAALNATFMGSTAIATVPQLLRQGLGYGTPTY